MLYRKQFKTGNVLKYAALFPTELNTALIC